MINVPNIMLFVKLFYGRNLKLGPCTARTSYPAGPPPKGFCLATKLTKEYNYQMDPICEICYARKALYTKLPNIVKTRLQNIEAVHNNQEIPALRKLPKYSFLRLNELADFQSPDQIKDITDVTIERHFILIGTFTKTYRLGPKWLTAIKYFQDNLGPIVCSVTTPKDLKIVKELNSVPSIVIPKENIKEFINKTPVKPFGGFLPKMIPIPCPNQIKKFKFNNKSFFCSKCKICAPPATKKLLQIIQKSNYTKALAFLQH